MHENGREKEKKNTQFKIRQIDAIECVDTVNNCIWCVATCIHVICVDFVTLLSPAVAWHTFLLVCSTRCICVFVYCCA